MTSVVGAELTEVRARALDEMLDAVLVADDRRRYVDANAAACALFGMSREEIVTKCIDDLLPSGAGIDVDAAWRKFLSEGQQEGEFSLKCHDGVTRCIEFRAKANVTPGRHVSTLRDVSDRALAHRRTRASEMTFRRLADALPFIVARFDREHRRLYANRGMDAMVSVLADGFSDETKDDLGKFAAGRAKWHQLLEAAFDGHEVREEFEFLRKDGTAAYFDARLVPEREEASNGIDSVLAVTIDVTGQRRLERELRDLAGRRDRWLGVVSHDLRNPLNAIAMAATLILANAATPPDVQRLATRIQTGAERMAAMIAQLLDFVRIEQGGGIAVERVPANLAEIAARAVEECELGSPGARIELVTDGAARGNFAADGLARVFSNLLANAVQYGDGRARVVIRERGENVRCEVTNAGEPIRAEALDVIFEPFRRLETVRGHTNGKLGLGLGLGLFITRSIVRSHGGTIGVCSDETGTTFWFELPRDVTDEVDRAREQRSGPHWESVQR